MLDNGGGYREYQLPCVVAIVPVHRNIVRAEVSVGNGVEYCSGRPQLGSHAVAARGDWYGELDIVRTVLPIVVPLSVLTTRSH